MTTATADAATQMANALQRLVDLIEAPGQTPEELQRGETNFVQLRDVVNRMYTELQGTGNVSLAEMKQVVMAVKPVMPQIETRLEEITQRLLATEGTIEPILKNADEKLKNLAEYSQKLGEDNKGRVEQLMQRAHDKFQEQEVKVGELISASGEKFKTLEQQQAAMTTSS